MRLLYVFAAIVGAVSGLRQTATVTEDLVLIPSIPSGGFLNAAGEGNPAHVFDTDNNGRCLSGLYIAKELNPTGLYRLNNAATDLNPMGDPKSCPDYSEDTGPDGKTDNISYNAIGYDSKSNFIFGVTDHEHEEFDHHMVRIDRHGCTEPVAELGRLPFNSDDHSGRHIAGDVYRGRTLWVSSGRFFRAVGLTAVDENGEMVHAYTEYSFPNCRRMNDFAFSPSKDLDGNTNQGLKGQAFGWSMGKDGVAGPTLCRFSPGASGPDPEELGTMGIDVGGNTIGGFFFDAEGSVFMYDNNQDKLYKYLKLDAVMRKYDAGECEVINSTAPPPAGCEVELAPGYPFVIKESNDDFNVDGAACVTAAGGIVVGPPVDKRCKKRDPDYIPM